MKRLLVDMDGVLADTYEQFIRLEFEETANRITKEEISGISEDKAFPNFEKHVRQEGFFRNPPVMKDAVSVMEKLNKAYEIFIVSSAMEFPNSLREKYDWLEEHFPFLSWKQIILCGSKVAVKGDFLIDDHFKNLDPFEGKSILFTQPHNNKSDDNGHQRVGSWKEIEKMLL
ncbi:5'(3')-deoxyribonucleotidase [Joostella atrarenae]|uniref:5'(3')-deoxyribonucleotidase n=1 Tax=Joostella atrarenae TaxID=679257 RepID=A0ABS9IYS7_9FLAO|nr:5'(3')-deoxyribonucleotidase [Joostella atrarenae]MCF8713327.1 5'(3')-deoxyribonucleotidase [Joostella atrarenae]